MVGFCITVFSVFMIFVWAIRRVRLFAREKEEEQRQTDKISESLHVCPFCKENVKIKISHTLHLNRCYEITCNQCGFYMWDYSLQDLTENWNTAGLLSDGYKKADNKDKSLAKFRRIIKCRPDYNL